MVVTEIGGRVLITNVWVAGTVGGAIVHATFTAGDGAWVAVNVVSESKGERLVDHELIAPFRN